MIAAEVIQSILDSVVSVEKDIETALQDFARVVIRGFEAPADLRLEIGEHVNE